MRTLLTLEGYFKNGSFHTYKPISNIPVNGRVLITILEDNPPCTCDTWADFDKLVDELDEKPKLEDFPRCNLSRPTINFDEV